MTAKKNPKAPRRPVAPHGYDAHPRHSVCAAVRSDPEDPTYQFVDVLLLPAERAKEQIETGGGYTVELAHAHAATGLRLLFSTDRVGRVITGGRGESLSAKLRACKGGLILPGDPPPIAYKPGEAEAYPFCFLVGIDVAITHLAGWAEWAASEEIDVDKLRLHLESHTMAPPRTQADRPRRRTEW